MISALGAIATLLNRSQTSIRNASKDIGREAGLPNKQRILEIIAWEAQVVRRQSPMRKSL